MPLAKGYFKDEKLDVTIDQGEGSAGAVTRVMSGAYDAAFGDANAVIQNAALKPGEAPLIVYMMYSRAPFALLTKASSSIATFKDLAGKVRPRDVFVFFAAGHGNTDTPQ